MEMFDTRPPETLNQDKCVVCHEIGHAVTWFSYGEAIGPLLFQRIIRTDGRDQLLAKVTCWPRNGDEQALLTKEYAEPWAERKLAGDIAARLAHGNIPTDQITAEGIVFRPSSSVPAIINQLPEEHDLKMVLKLARNNAHDQWLAWVAARFQRAAGVVNENWHRIESIAMHLQTKLPERVGRRCIQGTDLIALMAKAGVRSRKAPPVEIVFNDNVGSFCVRARRFYWSLGRSGTVNIYVDSSSGNCNENQLL